MSSRNHPYASTLPPPALDFHAMKHLSLFCLCLPLYGLAFSLSLFFTGSLSAAEPIILRDGDRVVFLGNTLIEREQRHGYWEAALTSRFHDCNITFRNLGWSGDTVWGHARAGFGSPTDGFRHLNAHVAALKPTVVIVGYGNNESFDGPAGLARFEQGLNTLIDTLIPIKTRIILLGPIRQEDLGRPLPHPAAQNQNIRLYTDTMKAIAKKRGLPFLDLYQIFPASPKSTAGETAPITDNGLHLTAWGYWQSAPWFANSFANPPAPWLLTWKPGAPSRTEAFAQVDHQADNALAFRVLDAQLPAPPSPADGRPTRALEPVRLLTVPTLPPGKYQLTIDGKPTAQGDAAAWARGVALTTGPELAQAEQLRQAILAKNEQYFHRWRPQNETYLFGFRKHEQGKNASEIPKFDPIVDKLEADIARLRKPVPHTYELKRVEK